MAMKMLGIPAGAVTFVPFLGGRFIVLKYVFEY